MQKKSKSVKKGEETIELLAQSLVDIDIEVSPDIDGASVQLNYSIVIDDPVEIEHGNFFFTCHLSVNKVSKTDDGEQLSSIEATYACMILPPSEMKDLKNIAKQYASTSIWNAFVSLFAVLSQQMQSIFPPLPPIPTGVGETGQPSIEEDDEGK